MPLFSMQELKCCICGVSFQASVQTTWHGFDQGVCGSKCFYEKEWRRTLSVMGKPYRPDPREYDASGYPVRKGA